MRTDRNSTILQRIMYSVSFLLLLTL